jgi:hypothetical protein
MGKAFTITDSAANVVEYLESKKILAQSVIVERVNSVNAMMADMVRTNLSGEVLKLGSGRLRGTVRQFPARFLSGNLVSGTVTAGGPEAPYGVYFEEGGTHAFEIIPIYRRALMFMVEGQKIFAKLVHHPPIPLKPWFGPAVDWASGEMAVQLSAAMKEVAGGH